jgi:hypothetical protein
VALRKIKSRGGGTIFIRDRKVGRFGHIRVPISTDLNKIKWF